MRLNDNLRAADTKNRRPIKKEMIMKKRAFTLIELLVVISIIAVLMSIMMPALQKARNSAKKIICSSNIKNLSQSTLLYVEDNDKHFPTMTVGQDGTYSGSDASFWDDKIFTYVQNYDVFKCPLTVSGFRESVKEIESYSGNVEKHRHVATYRFNRWLEGWDYQGTRPWPQGSGSKVVTIPFSISQVKNTANVVMFSDGSGVRDSLNGLRKFSYFYNGSLRYMPDIMPAHDIRLKNSGVIIPFQMVPECSGGVSLGFSDGHVETITRFDYTIETVSNKTPPREGIKINPVGSEIR
jgi:prepilin-type N-terminal cleavage/methylation domain-containing protein